MGERNNVDLWPLNGDAEQMCTAQTIHDTCASDKPPNPETRKFLAAVAENNRNSTTLVNLYSVNIRQVLDGIKQAAPKNVWVYSFYDNALAGVGHAKANGEWDGYWMRDGTPMLWPTVDRYVLDLPEYAEGPEDALVYYFLLSPVELPAEMLDSVAKRLDSHDGAVRVVLSSLHPTVLLSNPLEQVVYLHNEFYVKALRALSDFHADPSRQDKLFIASTLQSWAKHDKYGTRNELRETHTHSDNKCLRTYEPGHWLDDYKKLESRRRSRVETAAKFIADQLTSDHFVLIADACMANGGQDLQYVAIALATSIEGLSMCLPGKHLLVNLATDRRYLPAKHLLNEVGEASFDLPFETYRYGALAVNSLFVDLLPAVAPSWSKAEMYPRIDRYLSTLKIDRFKEDIFKVKRYSKARANIKNGSPVYSGYKLRHQYQLHTDLKQLDEQSFRFFKDSESTKPLESFRHSEFVGKWGPFLDSGKTLGLGILETINLCFAISEFATSPPSEGFKNLVGLVGSSADLLLVVSEVSQRIVDSQAGKAALQGGFEAVPQIGMRVGEKAIAGLIIVSSACDLYAFANSAIKAFSRGQYQEGIGHAISAVGAATSLVAGILIFWMPIGGLVMALTAIGAVLIGIGSFVVAVFSRNPFEDFAEACFLGDGWSEKAAKRHHKPTWYLPHGMPTDDIASERRNLMTLLTSFELHLSTQYKGEPYLTIRPGFLPPGSVFEINVRYRFQSGESDSHVEYVVDEELFRILKSSVDLKKIANQKSQSGLILYPDKTIEVLLVDLTPSYDSEIEKIHVYVRLRIDGIGAFHPTRGNWVRVDGQVRLNHVSSLDRAAVRTDEHFQEL